MAKRHGAHRMILGEWKERRWRYLRLPSGLRVGLRPIGPVELALIQAQPDDVLAADRSDCNAFIEMMEKKPDALIKLLDDVTRALLADPPLADGLPCLEGQIALKEIPAGDKATIVDYAFRELRKRGG